MVEVFVHSLGTKLGKEQPEVQDQNMRLDLLLWLRATGVRGSPRVLGCTLRPGRRCQKRPLLPDVGF